MVSFGEKAKIKKAGNLNYGRSYVTTTVAMYVLPFNNLVLAISTLNSCLDYRGILYQNVYFFFKKKKVLGN